MDLWKLEPGKPVASMAADERLPEEGFAWLDLSYDEVDRMQAEVERLEHEGVGLRRVAALVLAHDPEDAFVLVHPGARGSFAAGGSQRTPWRRISLQSSRPSMSGRPMSSRMAS